MTRALQALGGAGVLLVMAMSTVVLTVPLCVCAIGKFLAPAGAIRDTFRKLLAKIAESWISINNGILSLQRYPRWDVVLPSDLDRKGCYLVSCNHQSWVDILVLQRWFNRRLPLLRFFLKSQLIWVPFLGVAWWALDFPFMRRVSKEKLARRPGLKGRDLENARKACEKFRNIPVSMMTFPEGTRFSTDKQIAGGRPFRHLLSPRVGGIGQVLYALGDELDALIDVTIVYPQSAGTAKAPTFWELVSGRIPEIHVRVEKRPIPAELLNRNFSADRRFRRELESWVNGLWREKDDLISELLEIRSDR